MAAESGGDERRKIAEEEEEMNLEGGDANVHGWVIINATR